MFFKLELEQGEYQKADGTICNLIAGETIYTPDGKVTKTNLRGWKYFATIEEAEIFFGITKIEQNPIT